MDEGLGQKKAGIVNNPLAQIPAEEPTQQDPPFYNVMPKSASGGTMVSPKITITQEIQAPKTPSGARAFFAEYKTWIIIIGTLVILTIPAYFLINKYITNPKQDSLLTDDALKALENGGKSPVEPIEPVKTQTTAEWQEKYFGARACQKAEQCGDDADPDHDGLKNLEEFKKDTDPNNPDSDQDGLADGDEVFVFNSDPAKKSTVQDPTYNDGEYIKGGYNPLVKNKLYTPAQIADVSAKMRASQLHMPTITTLGEALLEIYDFTPASAEDTTEVTTTETDTSLDGIDQSPESRQDRDTQRSNTIKNLSIALVKYFDDNQSYPSGSDFTAMFNAVKPYLKIATNPVDPINKGQYVYAYSATDDSRDFAMTFYSETQSQIIRTRAADALNYKAQEEAALFDDKRKNDLETLRTALLLYSANNTAGNAEYVFPTKEQYQTALVPQFIGEIPKDPKSNEPYEYQVSETFDSFTLKSELAAPPAGRTGYLCNQEECRVY